MHSANSFSRPARARSDITDVSQWAEIRRFHEIDGLSQREIARRARCHRDTVRRALSQPVAPTAMPRTTRGSILDPFKPKIDQLVAESPELSAVRTYEEISQGDMVTVYNSC